MNCVASIFNVSKSSFEKSIEVPSSKSYANRLLILASIIEKPVEVINLPLSSDVDIMMNCLKEVGLELQMTAEGVLVKNSFPACEKDALGPLRLETKDGGTTNRFLAAFLARGKREYILEPEGHMRKRPMEGLVTSLRSLGATIKYDDGENWLSIKGPMTSRRVEVDCSQTTQFLTGVALATSDLGIEVVPNNLGVSLPYWELTKSLLAKAQAQPDVFTNPVDFSSLSYPLALAAVTGDVTVRNCKEKDIFQADSLFLDVLKDMGVSISFQEDGLHCQRKELKALEFDGSQCPDVIPTLLYVCSFAEGVSRIFNLEVLTHKECDRFVEMINILENFEVDFTFDPNSYEITITGEPGRSLEKDYLPPPDHRMVMVTYLFQRTLGGGQILDNSHHVAKSFSNFFEVMK